MLLSVLTAKSIRGNPVITCSSGPHYLLWTITTLIHSPAFRKFPDSCDIQYDVLSLSLRLRPVQPKCTVRYPRNSG